ncbi:LOW QUALITY PROTEIN: protein HIDE1 [Pituophis catenifer annectens]|uniref:LOW QUALITY PROTEIN: protein HIDE1 n=1 Tax=Pituophis catenifer annectens TaxID=94852 RepID=UPI003995D347
MVFPISVCKRNEMFHSNVELKIIFLLTGCMAAFRRFPSPHIFLNVLSDEVTEGDSLKIACFAPSKYMDGWFFLFKNNESKALKTLPAAEAQHNVTFLLENVKTRDGGRYRCQYGLYNGSQLQESEFSQVLEITVKGAAWFLPITFCVTGILLLVLILSAAVGTTAYFKRRKKKRKLKSCWAETSYPTAETSFDNCMFIISEKSNQEIRPTIENPGASISSATSPRLVSRISLEKQDFSTFRASE